MWAERELLIAREMAKRLVSSRSSKTVRITFVFCVVFIWFGILVRLLLVRSSIRTSLFARVNVSGGDAMSCLIIFSCCKF